MTTRLYFFLCSSVLHWIHKLLYLTALEVTLKMVTHPISFFSHNQPCLSSSWEQRRYGWPLPLHLVITVAYYCYYTEPQREDNHFVLSREHGTHQSMWCVSVRMAWSLACCVSEPACKASQRLAMLWNMVDNPFIPSPHLHPWGGDGD